MLVGGFSSCAYLAVCYNKSMNEITQEVTIQVFEAPGVPNTGGTSFDSGLMGGWGLALGIALLVVATTAVALTWRKSRMTRRIFTPIIALTLIAVPLATSVSAATATPHDEPLTITVIRPETTGKGVVDLSGLEALPYAVSVENISDASITVDAALDEAMATVDIDVPASVALGDYTADIVYILPPTTMQDMTQAYCDTLEEYNGTTGDAITLTDPRNDQDYNIAKLADGKCWMLNNLKLGSTTGTMALTPEDTNISSGWTLPQVGVSNVNYFDQPVVDGPVPGSIDDISSDNFYGYLYNWCGATAGGTASGGSNTCTTSGVMPEDATGDVCPAGWRMPTGGYVDTVGNELSMLNAKMGGYADNTEAGYLSNYWNLYANFQPDGAWRGTWSGSRYSSSWYSQGSYGFWWSSSRVPSSAEFAFRTDVGPSYIFPDYNVNRSYRIAVRCLFD